jgi:hypothetical protein
MGRKYTYKRVKRVPFRKDGFTQKGCCKGGGTTMSYLRRMSTSIPGMAFNSKQTRAARKIQRATRKIQVANFYSKLIHFKNALVSSTSRFNGKTAEEIKNILVSSIPDGDGLGKLINRPDISKDIERLKTQLSADPPNYLTKDTPEYNALIGLIKEIRRILERKIPNLPPIVERPSGPHLQPSSVMSMDPHSVYAQAPRKKRKKRRK